MSKDLYRYEPIIFYHARCQTPVSSRLPLQHGAPRISRLELRWGRSAHQHHPLVHAVPAGAKACQPVNRRQVTLRIDGGHQLPIDEIPIPSRATKAWRAELQLPVTTHWQRKTAQDRQVEQPLYARDAHENSTREGLLERSRISDRRHTSGRSYGHPKTPR